ncbi:hypothetical protein [Fusobacterium varium]
MGLLSIFKKSNDEEYLKKIEKLEETLSSKENEISNLINEIESLNKFTPRQLEVFEKNLKENKEEVQRLKDILDSYCIPYNTKERYSYKVEIEKFFSSSKFQELNTALKEKGITYLQEINSDLLDAMPEDLKGIEEGKKKYQDYLNKNIEWEIVTLLNKGEKISKIYSKTRKFANILSEGCYEFMEDMRDYDFNSLVDAGFSAEQIKEFKEKRDEYYLEKRIEK